MFSKYWFYDAILYVYALSLLFYFSDFVSTNRSAKRIGTGLLVLVLILQSVLLFQTVGTHLDLILLSQFEYWIEISWLLTAISLVMIRFAKIEIVVFFINVISFGVWALNSFSKLAKVPVATWGAQHKLLIVHISLVSCSFAALAVGAICSGIYLFLHRRLKVKRWSHRLIRLPALDTVDRYAFRIGLIGVPLLALSLCVAVASIVVENRISYLWDWKVISSFISLGLYSWYILQRILLNRAGTWAAQWNLICFGSLIVNALLNPISKFH